MVQATHRCDIFNITIQSKFGHNQTEVLYLLFSYIVSYRKKHKHIQYEII